MTMLKVIEVLAESDKSWAGAYTTAYTTQFNGFPGPDTVVMEHVHASRALIGP